MAAITSSKPLSYAYDRPNCFRNGPREKDRGYSPIYFTPSDRAVGVNGFGGPNYVSGMTGNCTWWAWGRCYELNGVKLNFNGGAPDATNWFDRYDGDKTKNKIGGGARTGDILCWSGGRDGKGHVQVIEQVWVDRVIVSESYDGVSSGLACVTTTIYKNNPTYGSCSFIGVIHTGGGSPGGGIDPDNPPIEPGIRFEPATITRTIERWIPYSVEYNDLYECGNGPLFADDSGDQDNPKAPTHISSSSERRNQRWEPFNMYTYERKLTYKKDKTDNWSEWEEKYFGIDNFSLGDQPQYGNGWEMDWEDERE